MAKRKAKAKKTTKKKAARAKAKPKGKAKAKAKAKAKKRSGETEVERRWNEYWRCRKQLEDAVEAVRSAQESLASAMELERERRTVFEETKQSLEQLLEVAPPSPSGSSPQARLDLVSSDTE